MLKCHEEEEKSGICFFCIRNKSGNDEYCIFARCIPEASKKKCPLMLLFLTILHSFTMLLEYTVFILSYYIMGVF